MYTELRRALKTAKLDQYELANWLGVSASAVSNRMTGKSRWPPDGKTRPAPPPEPSADTLAALRDACLAVAATISA